MTQTDKDLLERLANPKIRPIAFAEIVRQNQEPLYWHIRKMVLNHDDSNDVLQNTLLKAWKAIGGFRGESKISTWLYRIASNEIFTFLAQQKARLTISTDTVEESLFERMKADSYFDGNEAELKLQRAILSLPDKQRIVFTMKYFDDMSYADMEAILGTSVGALKASYHHAYKKIEKQLLEE